MHCHRNIRNVALTAFAMTLAPGCIQATYGTGIIDGRVVTVAAKDGKRPSTVAPAGQQGLSGRYLDEAGNMEYDFTSKAVSTAESKCEMTDIKTISPRKYKVKLKCTAPHLPDSAWAGTVDVTVKRPDVIYVKDRHAIHKLSRQ